MKYVALLFIVTGTVLGIFGSVRTGAILLAIGTATYVTLNFFGAKPRRRIELIIPLGMCLVLVAVALTLPHAK